MQNPHLVDVEKIEKAHNDVRNDNCKTKWAVFKNVDKDKIDLCATGSKYDSFLKHLKPDEGAYAVIRMSVKDTMSKGGKYAFITWIGEEVPLFDKILVATGRAVLLSHLGSPSIELVINDIDDIKNETKMRERMSKFLELEGHGDSDGMDNGYTSSDSEDSDVFQLPNDVIKQLGEDDLDDLLLLEEENVEGYCPEGNLIDVDDSDNDYSPNAQSIDDEKTSGKDAECQVDLIGVSPLELIKREKKQGRDESEVNKEKRKKKGKSKTEIIKERVKKMTATKQKTAYGDAGGDDEKITQNEHLYSDSTVKEEREQAMKQRGSTEEMKEEGEKTKKQRRSTEEMKEEREQAKKQRRSTEEMKAEREKAKKQRRSTEEKGKEEREQVKKQRQSTEEKGKEEREQAKKQRRPTEEKGKRSFTNENIVKQEAHQDESGNSFVEESILKEEAAETQKSVELWEQYLFKEGEEDKAQDKAEARDQSDDNKESSDKDSDKDEPVEESKTGVADGAAVKKDRKDEANFIDDDSELSSAEEGKCEAEDTAGDIDKESGDEAQEEDAKEEEEKESEDTDEDVKAGHGKDEGENVDELSTDEDVEAVKSKGKESGNAGDDSSDSDVKYDGDDKDDDDADADVVVDGDSGDDGHDKDGDAHDDEGDDHDDEGGDDGDGDSDGDGDGDSDVDSDGDGDDDGVGVGDGDGDGDGDKMARGTETKHDDAEPSGHKGRSKKETRHKGTQTEPKLLKLSAV